MKGFLLMEGLLKLVGMKTLFRLGRVAGGAAWHLLPQRRKIVERNLRIALNPALRGRELKKLGKENFKRTIANFLCSAKTAILTDDQLKKCVEITGHEAFARPVLEGRGQVCAIAHSGNWEVLARIRVFYPEIERYGSMYRQFDNPLMEEYMYRRRTERGTQMFSKEGGIKAPMKMLKEGGALGVLSDQFVWEGVYVPFFGKVTGTTPLPALLAQADRGGHGGDCRAYGQAGPLDRGYGQCDGFFRFRRFPGRGYCGGEQAFGKVDRQVRSGRVLDAPPLEVHRPFCSQG